MHLTPREVERLQIMQAADLARRRLARGSRLGATEAAALVADEALELAWDDHPLGQIVEHCRGLLTPDQLLPGVSALVPVVQVEALFPHGTVLVHVPQPFGPPAGAGESRPGEGSIELAPGRVRATVTLHNTGDRPVFVSSHVPLDSLNPVIRHDAPDDRRWRLDIAAGTAVRLSPDESREVGVIATEEATS